MRRSASVLALLMLATMSGRAQMPDLRQMSGQPLPSAELSAGTVSVRIVRQTLANNVPGHDVELTGGAAARRAKTDANGRAVFNDVAPGAIYRVHATVDGERIESQPFTMPASGGVRLLLAAGLAAAQAPGAPTQPGTTQPGTTQPGTTQPGTTQPGTTQSGTTVQPGTTAQAGAITLGGQSRLVVEVAEELVEVFNLFELVNPASGPMTPGSPFVFQVPPEALNTSVLEGSTQIAKVENGRIVVTGPLPPGRTELHFAYRLSTQSGKVAIRQPVPIAVPQMTVIVRRHGDLDVTIAGERARRDVPIEGRSYIVATTGPIAAGMAIAADVAGLPTRARWPLALAFTLAGAIVLAGVWFATRGTSPGTSAAEDLAAARASRFDELLALERQRRTGKEGNAATARREALIEEIVELDLAIASLRTPDTSAAGSEVRRVAADSPQSV